MHRVFLNPCWHNLAGDRWQHKPNMIWCHYARVEQILRNAVLSEVSRLQVKSKGNSHFGTEIWCPWWKDVLPEVSVKGRFQYVCCNIWSYLIHLSPLLINHEYWNIFIYLNLGAHAKLHCSINYEMHIYEHKYMLVFSLQGWCVRLSDIMSMSIKGYLDNWPHYYRVVRSKLVFYNVPTWINPLWA
jgi:hypothetical protein